MTRYVTILESLGLAVELSSKLEQFQSLFLRWNAQINLSAARTPTDVDEHIVDSLHVIEYLESASRVIDVGSGGGFPVVIAAICRPETVFVSLEPAHKKHAFLRTAARELALSNLRPLAVRVEDHDVRDYDVAMSRATFDLREWLELGLTLVRVDGVVIGFEAVQRDDLPQPLERHSYNLMGKQRSLVIVRRAATS